MSSTQSEDREKLTKLIERLNELRAQQKITKAAYERLLKEYEAQMKEIDSTLVAESTARSTTLMAGASGKESTAPRIVSIEEGSSSSRPRIVDSKAK